MSFKKRSAGHLADIPESEQSSKKGPSGRRMTGDKDGMGDFEDEWEDEVDRDEEVVEGAKSDNEDGERQIELFF